MCMEREIRTVVEPENVITFENDIFNSFTVTVLMIEGEPWFIGNEVTNVLGYSNGRKAVNAHVRDRHRANVPIWDGSQRRYTKIISEAGFYALVLRSKMDKAEKFSDWVTEEVLPSIRKTGKYSLVQDAGNDLKEELKVLREEMNEMRSLYFSLKTRMNTYDHINLETERQRLVGGINRYAHEGGEYLLQQPGTVLLSIITMLLVQSWDY